MAKKPSVSLETFARIQDRPKSGSPCWVCNIPERSVIEKGRASGMTYRTIQEWLATECGYGIQSTYYKIKGHFTQGRHHKDKAK